jgi:hypothetical protein
MALRDGLVLAEFLCNSRTLEEAVRKFDQDSIPRCRSAIKKSHYVIALIHSTGWRFWLAVLLIRVISLFMSR